MKSNNCEKPENIIEKSRELINFTIESDRSEGLSTNFEKFKKIASSQSFEDLNRFPHNEIIKEIDPNLDLINLTDRKGNILFTSPDFLNLDCLLVEANEDSNANSFRRLKHPDMPRSVYSDMWNTISLGFIWSGIICNKTKNEENLWFSTNVFPILRNGELTHFLAVYKPIGSKIIFDVIDLYRKIP